MCSYNTLTAVVEAEIEDAFLASTSRGRGGGELRVHKHLLQGPDDAVELHVLQIAVTMDGCGK